MDDDCEFRRSLKKLLQKAGYQVSQASNGIQASQMLSEKNYPLILLDIHMPGKSGLSVLNEVKKRSPESSIWLSQKNPQNYHQPKILELFFKRKKLTRIDWEGLEALAEALISASESSA